MTTELRPIDVLIVVVYVLGNLLIGVYFARRQVGLQSYFLGDRNVAWWLILASIVTTETSTVTFLSVPGVAFREGGNLTFIQLALGYVVGRILIAWLLLPQYFKGEILSAYQVLRQRFDARVQRAASGLFLLTRSVADGLRLYLTALLLHLFTGWPEAQAVLVLSLITIVYTYLGGMHAVMWTDLIQFAVKIGGALVAAGCILAWSPGGWAGLSEAANEAGKLTWLNPTPDPTVPYALWAGLIGGAFLTMATHGADQMMVQRYLCARSLGQARLALVLSGFVILAQFLLFLLIGVGLWYLHGAGVLELPEGVRADAVFGRFIVGSLPVGLRGLVVAAVLAAAMSTLSASLNSSATAFVVDFYRPLRPGKSEGHYLGFSRMMTAFWGVVQVGVALATQAISPQRGVVDNVLSVAGWSTGIVLGLFVLGSLRRPVSSGAAVAGVLSGAVAVTLVMRPWASEPLLAWPWYAAVGTLTTVAVALAAEAIADLRSAAKQPEEGARGPSGDGRA
jgi:SSS family transporter